VKKPLVIQELGLVHGDARIDIAVVDGSLHGYEIKSEKDSLARLHGQQKIYNMVFKTVTIIASSCHIDELKDTIPYWWGIAEAVWDNTNSSVEIYWIRIPHNNPSPDRSAVARLLWRDEALEELAVMGLDEGLRSKPRKEVYERLAQHASIQLLQEIISRRFTRRQNWRIEKIAV
jgi:hypothetical protein